MRRAALAASLFRIALQISAAAAFWALAISFGIFARHKARCAVAWVTALVALTRAFALATKALDICNVAFAFAIRLVTFALAMIHTPLALALRMISRSLIKCLVLAAERVRGILKKPGRKALLCSIWLATEANRWPS